LGEKFIPKAIGEPKRGSKSPAVMLGFFVDTIGREVYPEGYRGAQEGEQKPGSDVGLFCF